MKPKKPAVSIIIPNFNGLPFVEKCLRSVLRGSYSGFEVIFVDDGSVDGSLELVRKAFGNDSRFRIIRNASNLGAAAARNIGIRAARGEYLVFLDNDTEVAPNWLHELVQVLESSEPIGAAQSKVLDYHQRMRIDHAGVLLVPHVIWAVPRGGGEPDVGRYDSTADICALSVSLAVKREVIDSAGVFDTDLAVFTEDIDFSWRTWLRGYRVVLAPRSVVYHWNKPLAMRKRMRVSEVSFNYHMCKNSLRMIIKNYDRGNLLRYLPLALGIILLRSIILLVRESSPVAFIGSLKSIAWNILRAPNSLRERHKVQRHIRRVSDSYIMQRIMVKGTLLHIYRRYFSRTRT